MQVIALTEELLVTAKQSEDGMGTGTSADASHGFHHSENSDMVYHKNYIVRVYYSLVDILLPIILEKH